MPEILSPPDLVSPTREPIMRQKKNKNKTDAAMKFWIVLTFFAQIFNLFLRLSRAFNFGFRQIQYITFFIIVSHDSSPRKKSKIHRITNLLLQNVDRNDEYSFELYHVIQQRWRLNKRSTWNNDIKLHKLLEYSNREKKKTVRCSCNGQRRTRGCRQRTH